MYADSIFLSLIFAERIIPVSPIAPKVAQNFSAFSSLEHVIISPSSTIILNSITHSENAPSAW